MALSAGDTVVWYGTTDTDWEVVTNWIPQEIPIDQVHVVVSAAAINSMLVNLDRQGDTAGDGLDLRTFHIEEGCEVDVGSSGNPLKCTVLNTLSEPSIENHGRGTMYYSAETGSDAGNVTGYILVNSPNMDLAFHLSGDVVVGGLVPIAGRSAVSASFTSTLASLYVRRHSMAAVEPVVTIDAHATAVVTSAHIRGGVIDVSRELTNLYQVGGVFTQEAEVLQYAHVYGGVCILNTTSTLARAYLLGGVFDTAQNALAKTISGLYKFPEATFIRSPRLTVTTENDIFGDNIE